LQNRQLIFSPKIPYDLVAERSEANPDLLTFPVMWRWRELNSRVECFFQNISTIMFRLMPLE